MPHREGGANSAERTPVRYRTVPVLVPMWAAERWQEPYRTSTVQNMYTKIQYVPVCTYKYADQDTRTPRAGRYRFFQFYCFLVRFRFPKCTTDQDKWITNTVPYSYFGPCSYQGAGRGATGIIPERSRNEQCSSADATSSNRTDEYRTKLPYEYRQLW